MLLPSFTLPAIAAGDSLSTREAEALCWRSLSSLATLHGPDHLYCTQAQMTLATTMLAAACAGPCASPRVSPLSSLGGQQEQAASFSEEGSSSPRLQPYASPRQRPDLLLQPCGSPRQRTELQRQGLRLAGAPCQVCVTLYCKVCVSLCTAMYILGSRLHLMHPSRLYLMGSRMHLTIMYHTPETYPISNPTHSPSRMYHTPEAYPMPDPTHSPSCIIPQRSTLY